jgi:hypothetical protein
MQEPSTKARLKVIPSAETWTLHEEAVADRIEEDDDVRRWLEVRIANDELELPIMPDAPALLLQMAGDESCRVQDMVDVVQRDPSLAAHLLRVTQLALIHVADVLAYGQPEALETLRADARVAMLGLDAATLDALAEKRRQVIALARAMT